MNISTMMNFKPKTIDDTFGYISGVEPTSWKLGVQTTAVNQNFIITLENPSSINIDWGDGTNDTYTTAGDLSHTYALSGNHIISITGRLNTVGNIRFDNTTTRSRLKATGVPPGGLNLGGMTEMAFRNTFSGCTGLTLIANDFGRYNTGITSNAYNSTFLNCTGLTSIPRDFGRYNTLITTNAYSYTFQGCTGLTSIPSDFGRYNTRMTSWAYLYTFQNCTGLTSIPNDFGRYNTAITTNAYWYTFYDCTNLDGNAPALWTLYPNVSNGTDCFYNCTFLDNYTSIPTGWK